MAVADDDGVEGRLRRFLYGRIGRHLRRREQRESFALYAQGIIGEGERKSVEPIAARATADAVECERMQAKLLHFLRDSPWPSRPAHHLQRPPASQRRTSRRIEPPNPSLIPRRPWRLGGSPFRLMRLLAVVLTRQSRNQTGR